MYVKISEVVIIMIRLDNIKIFTNLSEEDVISKSLRNAKIDFIDVLECNIVKKSIDARDKKNVFYNYCIDVKVKDEKKYDYLKRVEEVKAAEVCALRKSNYRPVIVGSGPAGLFCALKLIDYGYKPIIIEQGDCVEKREQYVYEYRNTGKINELCNVQFGEGGAGTFSDGKLTTGINSVYIKEVLRKFYEFGAPKEILYLSKPHIGTDNLLVVLKNIRKYIEDNGGEYYFNTKLVDVKRKGNIIIAKCNSREFITDALVLAIGHSARDTFKMLKNNGFMMARKNFSVGVRIEHKQELINRAQYGAYTKLKLPAAEYKLVYHGKDRSCYTFCMCPGGEVIASASSDGTIVTNGMSTYKRDKENANSALLVNVLSSDFAGTDPLAGMYFQENLEKSAFVLGGKNHNAPVQLVGDFLKKVKSKKIGSVVPSYKPGYTLCDLHDILPEFVAQTLEEGIVYFDKKIKGFASYDAVLTGVETRSSSPVSILRNDDMEANIAGIYPCGEGAGYAGGITSAAVDGIKVAIKIIEKE